MSKRITYTSLVQHSHNNYIASDVKYVTTDPLIITISITRYLLLAIHLFDGMLRR